jgi:hypothetical protein
MATAPIGECSQPADFRRAKWDQAGAQAYYACRYFESVQDTNFWRNIIAGIQAATQIYFADKQYQTSKQAQDRLDNISNIELSRSGALYDQFAKGIACEDAQLLEACGFKVERPDINDIRRRVAADVKRIYAATKRKIKECYAPNCAAAMCSELNKTEREEARTLVGVTSATYQKETLLYEQRLATAKSWRYQVLAFGRGSIQASTALMQGAAQNAQLAAQINPYSGYIQAANGIAGTARSLSLQEANGFRGMGINMRQQVMAPAVNGTQVTGQDTMQPAPGLNPDSDNFDFQGPSTMPYGQSGTGFPSDGVLFDGNGIDSQPYMGGITQA